MTPKASRPVLTAVLFLAVGLGINAAIAAAYDAFAESRTLDARQERQFETFPDSIRVLAVGASHSVAGFDVRLTDDAFVYAFSGEPYTRVYFRLKHALERHPEVEHVFAPVGPMYFQLHEDVFPHAWIGLEELRHYGAHGGDVYDYVKDQFRRQLFPYAGQHQRAWDLVNGVGELENRAEMVRGFQPSFKRMNPALRDTTALGIIQVHYTGATDPLQTYYLERIAQLCAERGVRLTLVHWPTTEVYDRLAAPHYDPAVQEAAIAAVRRHLPADVVDLHDAFFGHPELFGNPDHVNADGAYRATRLLLERTGLPIREDVTGPLQPPAPAGRRRAGGTAATAP